MAEKKNLFQKAAEYVFVDPKRTPDTRDWDSLTPEEQDAVRMRASAKFVKGERTLSPFTQAVKTASEAVGNMRYKRPLAPPVQSDSWDAFMDKQAAKRAAQPRLFERVGSFPVGPAPAPQPAEVDANILLEVKKARTEGNSAKEQSLRELWESRKAKTD